MLRDLLERARDRREIRADADLDFLVELVFATLWYRILARPAALGPRFADQLGDTILALAARS